MCLEFTRLGFKSLHQKKKKKKEEEKDISLNEVV
jgi:hypothetical protein